MVALHPRRSSVVYLHRAGAELYNEQFSCSSLLEMYQAVIARIALARLSPRKTQISFAKESHVRLRNR
ncbi:hypothetical protein ANCCAN_04287 [Ancylostoma caninum]|uniref:Uncharacterized protein n=1 Tax=Ancylostoma caninum TaxID=29170 RepID=A0A368GZ71_ANCCA|nr:hypothetical protein ANCCAN_04287 [Ancylostoma caninum]